MKEKKNVHIKRWTSILYIAAICTGSLTFTRTNYSQSLASICKCAANLFSVNDGEDLKKIQVISILLSIIVHALVLSCLFFSLIQHV